MDAATKLLVGPLYNGLSVDEALRKWSNNGYGGDIAKAVGIDPTLRVRDLSPNQISLLTEAMSIAESGTAQTAPKPPSVTGSTDVISGGGIPEVPKGTRMSIPNVIYTEPGGSTARKPSTAEASTPPSTDMTINIEKRSAQIADLLDLPMATDMPPSTKRAVQDSSLPPGATIDADGTVHLKGEISKFSPDAPEELVEPTKAEVVRAVRARYDLRGLDPDEIDAVVGRALEARRISATARAGNSQLLESDSGYILLDKSTGNMTPLTSGGKVDTKRQQELSRLGTLSNFSREMSTPDFQVRPKMTDAQSKSLEFGSRALQANERQHRLDDAYADRPEELANEKTAILTTLEALPPDTNMGLATQVLGAVAALGSIGGDLTKWALKFFTDNPNPTVEKIEKALVGVGFSAAEARSKALLAKRADLSPDQKEFLDNQLNFSTAILRRDSGAAISTGEFISTYRQYFPTAGDTRRDVLRKMRTRQQTIRGMRSSAGRPLLIPDLE